MPHGEPVSSAESKPEIVARPFKPKKIPFVIFLLVFLCWVGYLFWIYLKQPGTAT